MSTPLPSPLHPPRSHGCAPARACGLLPPVLLALLCAAATAGPLTVEVKDLAGKPVAGVAVVVDSPYRSRPAAARPPVEIAQEKMRFVPEVAIVTPGTLVRFTNRDSWDHHVKGTRAQNFELRIAGADNNPRKDGPAAVERMLEGGTGPVILGCHIHSSMLGVLYVSESPWFGVSDADGLVRLPDVPDGPVTVVAWHPRQLLEQPMVKAVALHTDTTVALTLNFSPRQRR